MKKHLIFSDVQEDLYKIFLPTLIIFLLIFFTDIMTSTVFALITIYFLDGGHVYSTLLEVLADPEEVRKKYVWAVLMGSFFLNFFIHFLFTPYFFTYIFYFTIYHNMRQGLGVTFLYRIGESREARFVKWGYYFLTVMPFILFHMKPPVAHGGLGEAIISPINLKLYFSAGSLAMAYSWGSWLYLLGAAALLAFLILKKNMRGFYSMVFFGLIYAYAFLFSDNQMKGYALLIFSHAIPYYFLMKKRLELTHKLDLFKRYAWLFLFMIFLLGAIIDYSQEEIVDFFSPLESVAMALLTTPLISHFIYDAIIWKRGNERFKIFIDHNQKA